METREQTRPARQAASRAGLALTLLVVLAAVSVSSGLVAYTAWKGDLANGLFAILLAVLSAKAALSWCLWHHGNQQSAISRQQDLAQRKPAEETKH